MSIFDYFRKPAKSPEKSYLDEQRMMIGDRQRLGMEPYSYLPTVMGNIAAGLLPREELDRDELTWILDELQRQLEGMQKFGYSDAEIQDKRIEMGAYLQVLEAKGGAWAPVSAPLPKIEPPPFDPTRGR